MYLPDFDHPSLALALVVGGMLVLGAILWVESIHAARVLISLLIAAVGAVIGYVSPLLWHPVLALGLMVLIGAAAGAALGAAGFRVIQALLLAGFVAALAVGTLAWRQGVRRPPSPAVAPLPGAVTGPRSTAGQTNPAAAPKTARPAVGVASRPSVAWLKRAQAMWLGLWTQLIRRPAGQRNEILALGVAVALVVFLVGVIFSRATSLVAGSCLGFLLILAALALLGRWMDRTTTWWAWRHLHPVWIFIGGSLLGMAVQYRHVHRAWRQARKNKPAPKKAPSTSSAKA